MSCLLFDVETLSDSTESILTRLPEFDEDEARESVPANYKKPEAINGWIEDKRASHGQDIVAKAALNPLYSKVVLVSTWDGEVEQRWGDEQNLIIATFKRLSHLEEDYILPARDYLNGGRVAGFGLRFFDLPYLISRAFILRVPVPRSVFDPFSKWGLPDRFIDVKDVFCAGSYEKKKTHFSMNSMLRALGLPEKGSGADFGKLWTTDREKACSYARDEMIVLVEACKIMGLLS